MKINGVTAGTCQRPMIWKVISIAGLGVVAAGAALSLTGCIPSLYNARADSEVYGILEKVRAEHKLAMGHDGEEFSIDTEDSKKAPKDVTANDVLK